MQKSGDWESTNIFKVISRSASLSIRQSIALASLNNISQNRASLAL